MGRGVAQTGGGLAPYRHGGGTLSDAVDRADADGEVSDHRCGQAADEDGGASRSNDGAADVRDGWDCRSDHRADVHVGDASGWRQERLRFVQLMETKAPFSVNIPEAETSAVALAFALKLV